LVARDEQLSRLDKLKQLSEVVARFVEQHGEIPLTSIQERNIRAAHAAGEATLSGLLSAGKAGDTIEFERIMQQSDMFPDPVDVSRSAERQWDAATSASGVIDEASELYETTKGLDLGVERNISEQLLDTETDIIAAEFLARECGNLPLEERPPSSFSELSD
jgi:hypothetical protein